MACTVGHRQLAAMTSPSTERLNVSIALPIIDHRDMEMKRRRPDPCTKEG